MMVLARLSWNWLVLGNATYDSHFMHDLQHQAMSNADAIDRVWYTLLLPSQHGGPSSGSLYHFLTIVGLQLAVGTLLLFLVQWARNLIDNEIERPLTDLIWPMVVALLLANQGYLLALTTIGVRNSINYVNTSMLEILDQTLKVEARLVDMYNYRNLEEELDGIRHSCDLVQSDAEKLKSCKQNSEIKLNQLIEEWSKTNDKYSEHVYRRAGQQLITQTRASLVPSGNTNQRASQKFLPRDRAMEKIGTASLDLGKAFQRTLESCMLITAMLGPLAIGASLTPVGNKPIFAWLSALLSLGLAKLSYNLLTAIAITTFYFSGEQNFLFQDFVNGALNPLVAFGVASGGGRAIFDSLTAASPILRTQNYGSAYRATNSVESSNPKQ